MKLLLVTLCLLLSFSSYSFTSNQSVESVLSDVDELADKQEAIAYLQIYLETKQRSAAEQVEVLNKIGSLFYVQNALADAITTLGQAKEISIANQFKQSAAEISKLIGIYSYFKGDNQQALDAYQFSLNYYIDVNIPIKQAHLYNNIGLTYGSMGNTLFQLESYEKASKLYHVHGNEGDKIDISFNIAGLYLEIQAFAKAIEIFNEVISVRTKLSNYHGVAQANNHLSLAYKYLGKYELSEKYSQKALDYFLNNGYDADAAIELNNLAALNNELSNPVLAKVYAQRSIVLSTTKSFDDLKAYGLSQLARAEFQLGNIELAKAAIDKSDQIAKKLKHEKIIHENQIIHTLLQASSLNTKLAVATLYQYENKQKSLANKGSLEIFSRFESEQLSQKISQLKQAGELLALETQEQQAQRNFIIVIMIFSFILLFIFYRRKKAGLYHKQLEHTVKERTKDLEMVAQQLKIASKVKSQFLANMSHEIRTPLTAILGQSEAIVLGEVKENKINDEVKIIHKNSQHLLQLVNDILDLSKIEAGKLDLNPSMTRLESITNELANMFNSRAKRKGLKFTIVNHVDTSFHFNVDSLRLCQVLINFCSNAIKFTEKGEVTLTISKQGDQLFFAVKDTGIGMNSGQVKQVFDCFTQADSNVNRRFGGTGLGLFLSSNIAELLGADIEVESSVGEGSLFTFILPFNKTNQPLVNEETQSSSTLASVNLNYVGKILVVDDHDDILKLIKHFLQNLGLHVITASNARDAVNLAINEQPNVILLDIQMPEIGGVETLSMLKQQGCNQPTYALTANAMAHEVKSYMANGFSGYLQKPINRTDFVTMLDNHFERLKLPNITKPIFKESKVDFTDLITTFKLNISTDKHKIERYIEQHEYKLLHSEVHKIAGAAGMFGFTDLSKRAIELESILKSERYSSFDKISAEFLDEINRTTLNDNKSIIKA